MADWDVITRGWVQDGLLAEEQRPAVLERLIALPPEGTSLPVGPIVTLLVAGATWLLTGAVVTLLLLVGVDDEQVAGGLVSACGVASLLLGGVMRPAAKLLPLARGFLAAAPPLVTLGAIGVLSDTSAVALVMVPGMAGLALAAIEGSRAASATSSLALCAGTLVAVTLSPGHDTVWATLAIPACAVAIGLAALASRLLPVRSQVFDVMVPGGILFLGIDIFLSGTHFGPLWQVIRPNGDEFLLEKFLELLLVGGFLIAVGAASRSGWALVPALGLVALSTIGIASVFGSWIGGTIALALVGGAFLAGASLLWVLRSARTL